MLHSTRTNNVLQDCFIPMVAQHLMNNCLDINRHDSTWLMRLVTLLFRNCSSSCAPPALLVLLVLCQSNCCCSEMLALGLTINLVQPI
jgi:hypothetical protein